MNQAGNLRRDDITEKRFFFFVPLLRHSSRGMQRKRKDDSQNVALFVPLISESNIKLRREAKRGDAPCGSWRARAHETQRTSDSKRSSTARKTGSVFGISRCVKRGWFTFNPEFLPLPLPPFICFQEIESSSLRRRDDEQRWKERKLAEPRQRNLIRATGSVFESEDARKEAGSEETGCGRRRTRNKEMGRVGRRDEENSGRWKRRRNSRGAEKGVPDPSFAKRCRKQSDKR